jgi:ATPase components of ABC transporters with duplicated ATPase domains
MYYQINKGTKTFGANEVFADIQFEIRGNEKIAVIGRNGSGKTTLLKIIAKEEDLSSGTVHKQNKVEIGYLAQTTFDDEAVTVETELNKVFQPLFVMEKRLQELRELMVKDFSEKIQNEYATLSEQFELNNGYQYRTEMITVFTKFGFVEEDLSRSISTFSGGQRTKLAFVKQLLSKPDILLLDEPTNHLDLSTIEWLEGYLKNYPKAVVLVSHDRMFLDRVVDVVYELELGQLTRYSGNYTFFVQEKRIRKEALEKQYHNQQKEIERLEVLIEKFRYKKNKAAFAQSKIKYLERMDKVELPEEDRRRMRVSFAPKQKGGKRVLSLEDFVVGYDTPLQTLNLEIQQHDRIAVIGDNGTGKSTLVKSIVGSVPPLGGSLSFGHQIQYAYFDQQLAQWSSQKTVLEELWDEYPGLDRTTVRTVLGSFLFSGDDVFKAVSVLSGGEKVRLSLAKIMLEKANFLILDEPTNHLDMEGKEALENALLEYTGTLLFVSHDRYFINKLATKLLVLGNDEVSYFSGNYAEFQEKDSVEMVVEEKKEKREEKPKKSKSNFKKEFEKLEKKLADIEEDLLYYQGLFEEPEYYEDYLKMQELEKKCDELEDEKRKHYRELETLLEDE